MDAGIRCVPRSATRTYAELAGRAGYSVTSSSFSNAIGKLRTIGAAEGYEKDGGTRIADVLL